MFFVNCGYVESLHFLYVANNIALGLMSILCFDIALLL